MSDPICRRNLKLLVGDVGKSYRERMLPRAWFIVFTLASCAIWTRTSAEPIAAIASSAFLVAGCVRNWSRRGKFIFPGWRTTGFLISAYLALGAGPTSSAVQWTLLVFGALAVIDMITYALRTISESQHLNEYVKTLDERDLVALLPDEAKNDAARWQDGDDSKTNELALVLHLAAFYMSLETQNKRRETPLS